MKLYGNSDVYGLTDEQVLTGWMFYGTSWRTVPQKHRRGANDEQDRRQTVNSLFSGEFLKLYPIADSLGRVSWYAQNDRLPDDIPDDEWLFIRKSMNYIGELVIAGDDEGVSSALGKLKKFQEKQADGSLPSAFRLGAERLYNSFPPLFPVAGIYLLAGFVLLGWFVSCLARRREAGIRIRLAAVVLEAVLFTFLTIMLALVWIVGGHVPHYGQQRCRTLCRSNRAQAHFFGADCCPSSCLCSDGDAASNFFRLRPPCRHLDAPALFRSLLSRRRHHLGFILG